MFKSKSSLIVFIILITSAVGLMLFSSCAEETDRQAENIIEDEYLDDLPNDLDFDGESINIVHWNNSFVNRELTADTVTNQALDKAVLERNASIENRLNVKMKFIAGDVAPEYYMPILQEEILSGTADYDIIAGVQCQSGQLGINGCYVDLSTAKYIDLTKSYWNNDYINKLNVSLSRTFLLGGDISLTTTAWSSAMLYDKVMYDNVFGSSDELYETVLKGDWTLDCFFDTCRAVYSDLNENGIADEGDRFGYGLPRGGSIIDMFCFSSGITFSSRGLDGYPVLDVFNDGALYFSQKFIYQMENNPGVYAYHLSDELSVKYLNTLFEATNIDAISNYSRSNDEFGVIPYPKLNSSESEYHSWISDNTTVYSVPITIDQSRRDLAFAVLEAMAGETRRICLPAYYETVLSDKYTRDPQSRNMINLIHDGETTDFASVYSEALCGIGTIMRQQVSYGDRDFRANFLTTFEEAQKELKLLIDKYEKNLLGPVKPDDDPPEDPYYVYADIENNYTAANEISDNWETFGGKYRTSGVLLNNDFSGEYSYRRTDEGYISVISAPHTVRSGLFPTAAIQSKDTVPLDDLEVVFSTGRGFEFANTGYSSSFSFVWTDKPIVTLPTYTDQIGTNGLREAIPVDANALSVIFMGTKDTEGSVCDLMYIVMNDGTGTAPEIDHRVGYRWCIYHNFDLSEDMTVRVKRGRSKRGRIPFRNSRLRYSSDRSKLSYFD